MPNTPITSQPAIIRFKKTWMHEVAVSTWSRVTISFYPKIRSSITRLRDTAAGYIYVIATTSVYFRILSIPDSPKLVNEKFLFGSKKRRLEQIKPANSANLSGGKGHYLLWMLFSSKTSFPIDSILRPERPSLPNPGQWCNLPRVAVPLQSGNVRTVSASR